METFFPSRFNTSAIKEYYSRLKRRTLLVLQAMQTQADVSDQVEAIDEFFFSQFKPLNFHGPQGAEVKTIKQFEEMCILLTQGGFSADPKNMTVLAFFQALEVAKEQEKARQKAAKHR